MTTTKDLDILGDVHLERRFRTGVPLHRVGQREEMVWAQFEDSVMNTTAKMHVQTGDLFNEFSVSEATVLRASEIYRLAVVQNPDTFYVLYRGNHDASRDADKKSSFDVFQALTIDLPNVLVLTEVAVIAKHGKLYGFLPWHPFKSSTELATELNNRLHGDEKFEAVFCHCDVKSYGGTDDNLVPVNVLKHRTKTIYTGHIHLPHEFEQEGVTVKVVGSMQPYAHGEEAVSSWYQTIAFEDLMKQGHDEFENINVRVLITSQDQIVPEFNCLSCITKKVDATLDEEDDSETVVMEDFDMMALFRLSLKEHNVGAAVSETILNRFSEKKHG